MERGAAAAPRGHPGGPRVPTERLSGVDQAVRQAIFRAIDREEVFLSVNATMPYPENTEPLNNHLLMTNQEGYQNYPETTTP